MYAIVETGGKQYQVSEGDELKVEHLKAEVGSTVELDKVLALGGDQLQVGKPYVEGAKVSATVKEQGRDKKVVIGKFKRKRGYKRVRGHRQYYTLLKIDSIQG